jgi:capsular polysaccharide transport system ATP-binding protein
VELFEKRAHKGWVMVSHDPAYIREHCDHACVLEKGVLTVAPSVEEAIKTYQELP